MSEPIRQFEPGELELLDLSSISIDIKHVRKRLEKQLERRNQKVVEAHKKGATPVKIAAASKMTPARVSQLLREAEHDAAIEDLP